MVQVVPLSMLHIYRKSLLKVNDQDAEMKDDVISVWWNEKYEDRKKVNYDVLKSF